jgi:hypothetical protein
MDNMFAKQEAAMQERLAGTNPIHGIRMVFLQLLWINRLAGFFSPLLLECLPPSSFEYAELSTENSGHSMHCVRENPRRQNPYH